MKRLRIFSYLLLPLALASLVLASSSAPDPDPAQWNSHDVYEILNNSPWSRPVKVNSLNEGVGLLGSQGPSRDSNVNNTPPPTVGAAGGRRSSITGGRSRTYGSGNAGAPPTSSSQSGPTEVTIQWQSALVVQMAAAKKNDEKADVKAMKPLNEYVVAVIGLPMTAVGGRAASADSEQTMTGEEQERIERGLKTSVALVRSGHLPLTPDKVELDQGRDGRILLYFPKSDPIQPGDKSVEFRLVMGKTKVQKKFALKEMEYDGKLEL